MNIAIELPYGGPGAKFYVNDLTDHIIGRGRDYIIQGQVHCRLADHPKPQSLDVWLRQNFTNRKDVAQAVNKVIDELVSTGLFAEEELTCPDSGDLCKGIKLVKVPRDKQTSDLIPAATDRALLPSA